MFIAVFALQVGIAAAFANTTSAIVIEITDCCNVFWNDIRETRHRNRERKNKRKKMIRQRYPDLQVYYQPPAQQEQQNES